MDILADASPPTPNKEREAREERQEGREKKRFRVEIAGAFLLLVYTVVSTGMWWATKKAADATKDSVDLQIKIAEGSQAAWLIPSQQDLNRNFLSFGVQNMGGISAENVAVTVQIKLVRTSDSQTLWTESFNFETAKYLAPKQNTSGRGERTLHKYTRQDFERITKQGEKLILNWAATYNNGFKREDQQSGCAQYIALFKAPEVRAMPQWVSCEGAPQLLRQLQPPSEQWSLQ